MKGRDKLDFDLLILLVENWLMGDSRTMEIQGRTEAVPMGIILQQLMFAQTRKNSLGQLSKLPKT